MSAPDAVFVLFDRVRDVDGYRVYGHVMRKATAEQVEKATQLLTRHRPGRQGPDPDDGPAGALVPA